MKDFHDLLILCREKSLLDIFKVKNDIDKTFEHRNTKKDLPVKFDANDFIAMQTLWSAHLRKLGKISKELSMPERLENVVTEINNWLKKNKVV